MDIFIRTKTSPQSVNKTTSAKKTKGSDFKKTIEDTTDLSEDTATHQVATPQGVDALFLFLNKKSTLAREDFIQQGHHVLDLLHDMRQQILQGTLSHQTLISLRSALEVNVQDFPSDYPKLQELIQEIQTRAAVEIAKIERSSLI